ncbi:MAG: hypothetical protein Q8M56_08465, partial [Desulfobacterales bacterium]|nr:hypothetical protein [Desulfobacterales bacterium]
MKKFAIVGALIGMLYIIFPGMLFAGDKLAEAPVSDQAVASAPAVAVTQEALDALKSSMQVGVDTAWVLFTAFLVFFMNLGFAMVESGLCRAKNTVNILAKNFIVFALSSASFWVIGWGLMFGNGNSFAGLEGLFFAGGADNSPAMGEAYK